MDEASFPRSIRRLKHVWIPLRDGTRLSARIWLPDDAEQRPVPAILEYIPYRKNDWYAEADQIHERTRHAPTQAHTSVMARTGPTPAQPTPSGTRRQNIGGFRVILGGV